MYIYYITTVTSFDVSYNSINNIVLSLHFYKKNMIGSMET